MESPAARAILSQSSKPVGAQPHLVAFFLQLAIFWLACFIYERDGFFYGMSFIGSVALTLKWQESRSTIMPKWLSIALWVPGLAFLLLLAFVAIRHGLRA